MRDTIQVPDEDVKVSISDRDVYIDTPHEYMGTVEKDDGGRHWNAILGHMGKVVSERNKTKKGAALELYRFYQERKPKGTCEFRHNHRKLKNLFDLAVAVIEVKDNSWYMKSEKIYKHKICRHCLEEKPYKVVKYLGVEKNEKVTPNGIDPGSIATWIRSGYKISMIGRSPKISYMYSKRSMYVTPTNGFASIGSLLRRQSPSIQM